NGERRAGSGGRLASPAATALMHAQDRALSAGLLAPQKCLRVLRPILLLARSFGMERLHHDWAIAAMHSILEILPPETFGNSTKASVAFDIYQRLKYALEAYDAQLGMQRRRVEPSRN